MYRNQRENRRKDIQGRKTTMNLDKDIQRARDNLGIQSDWVASERLFGYGKWLLMRLERGGKEM